MFTASCLLGLKKSVRVFHLNIFLTNLFLEEIQCSHPLLRGERSLRISGAIVRVGASWNTQDHEHLTTCKSFSYPAHLFAQPCSGVGTGFIFAGGDSRLLWRGWLAEIRQQWVSWLTLQQPSVTWRLKLGNPYLRVKCFWSWVIYREGS